MTKTYLHNLARLGIMVIQKTIKKDYLSISSGDRPDDQFYGRFNPHFNIQASPPSNSGSLYFDLNMSWAANCNIENLALS